MSDKPKDNAELIQRYLYHVVKRLPQAQRSDIEKELTGLIDDMLADKCGDAVPAKADVVSVIKELGRPAELAAKYRGSNQFLIGPEYFDTYLLVLKIVLAATVFGLVLARAIGYIAEPPATIWEAIGLFFAAIFTAVVQAFAWVTGIFALIGRLAKDAPWKNADWNPDDLTPVPSQKATIKMSEPIVGIVFSVLFLVLVNTVPQLFAAYIFTDTQTTVPLFDLAVFARYLPLIDIMICVSILKDVLRLVVGRYTISLAAVLTVLNIVAMILFIFVFGPSSGIWNPNFMTSLGTSWGASAQAAYIWDLVPKILVGLSIFGTVVDSISTIVRAARHKETAAA